MDLDKDSFGGSIYPKTFCKLYCTSKSFSCIFLDLAVKQSCQGISCNMSDKSSQTKVCRYLHDMYDICSFQISLLLLCSWPLSIVSFTGSWCFVVLKFFFFLRWSVLLSFRRISLPSKDSIKGGLEGCSIERNFFFKVQCLESFEWFCIESCKWGAFWSLLSPCFFFPVVCCSMFFLFIVCGLKISLLFFMFFPLCFCVVILVAGQYHDHCFWTSNRNSVQRSVVTLAYTHCMELMKSVHSCDR